MPDIVPVSKESHAAKYWNRPASYAFYAQANHVPLVAAEMAKAAMAFPLAFIRNENTFHPAAILGMEPNRNLFVGPDGNWLGGYIPAALRSYPFQLLRGEGNQLVLCVNEASGLISDGPDGEPFFDDTGNPSQPIRAMLEFLRKLDQSREATRQACAALTKHNLITPWRITVKTQTGDKNIEGLFQINEQNLTTLPDAAFLELRKTGALPLAYCQLLSMQNLPNLGKLAQVQAQATARESNKIQASIEFDDDMIKFT